MFAKENQFFVFFIKFLNSTLYVDVVSKRSNLKMPLYARNMQSLDTSHLSETLEIKDFDELLKMLLVHEIVIFKDYFMINREKI